MDKEERMDPAAQELKEETMTAEPMDEETRRAMGILEEPVPIEDEEEEVFPQEPALIEVSYVLTEEELAQAFRAVGMYKIKGKRQWIYSALMVIVMAITVYNIVLDPSYLTMGCILIAVCVALTAMVWLVPNLGLKSRPSAPLIRTRRWCGFTKGALNPARRATAILATSSSAERTRWICTTGFM